MLDLILSALFSAGILAVLLGLVALYQAAGMAWLWVAVLMVFPFCVWLERRRPVYYGVWGDDGGPALPPPSNAADRPIEADDH